MSNSLPFAALIAPVFRPVHCALRKEQYAEYMLCGGRGSTKSSFVSLEIVLGLLRDPESNAIIYRKVAATLRESVYAQMVWAIEQLGRLPLCDCKLSPMEITYRPTGQRIMFRGADDPAKSKSIKLAKGYFKFLWFEELTEFDGMRAIETIKASVLRGVERAVTFYSYNPPESAKNWTNEEAAKSVSGRLVHRSNYTQVPSDWLGAEFIANAERMREANERGYRHMYLGEITGTGGQVFYNLTTRAIADSEINTFGTLYHGLDFGFAVDPDAALRMHYDRRTHRLYIFGERYQAGNSFEELAAKLKQLNPDGLTYIADSEDPRAINQLASLGIRISPARKGPGSVEHGIRWLQGLDEIVIDPARCPNAAREFGQYEYAQDRNGNFRADYPDKDNHTIDSARYGLEPVIGQRKAKVLNRAGLGV